MLQEKIFHSMNDSKTHNPESNDIFARMKKAAKCISIGLNIESDNVLLTFSECLRRVCE